MSESDLFGEARPLRLRLTQTEAYRRKQRLWKLHCDHQARVTRAFFPSTGGVELYLHNWFCCSGTPEQQRLADWIRHSCYARYRRIADRMEARDERREHERHSKLMTEELVIDGKKRYWRTRPFDALWCPLCPHNS